MADPTRDYKPELEESIHMTIDGVPHHATEAPCDDCFQGYPSPCMCGGQIHAMLDDEEQGGDTEAQSTIIKKCTKCGDSYIASGY